MKVSVEPYLKNIQQSSSDDVDSYGFQPLVAHEHGLRITGPDCVKPTWIVAETKDNNNPISTWTPNSQLPDETPQTRFKFTNVFQHGYTQGTIDFGSFEQIDDEPT